MENSPTRYVYECPHCHKLSESAFNNVRIKCGDCLMDHTEIVEMLPLGKVEGGTWRR